MSDTSANAVRRRAHFTGRSDFLSDMRTRIYDKIEREGLLRWGYFTLWTKGLLMWAWVGVSIYALWVVADGWWQTLLAIISLALAMVGLAFNVGHDFIHGAGVSDALLRRSRLARWFNAFNKASFDAIGASSHVWKTKHGTAHHTYTNVSGADSDIDQAPFVRLDPNQDYKPWYRKQHFYAWFMYGMLVPKWHFAGDYINVARGVIGESELPRPRGGKLALFIGGKAFFYGWMFGLPMTLFVIDNGFSLSSFALHFAAVFAIYLAVAILSGVILAVVFQLAHAVDGAAFVKPDDDGAIESAWAEHQVESTRDFYYAGRFANRPLNWLLRFYLGGLDMQTIHHLFPKVPHTLYHRIRVEFAAICEEHGVEYVRQPLHAALTAHGRWLYKMGHPPTTSPISV